MSPTIKRALRGVFWVIVVGLEKSSSRSYRVHIAQPTDDLHRIHIKEQEVERKNGKYGRYQSGSIWVLDRPTVSYIDKVPIGIALIEITERVAHRVDGLSISLATHESWSSSMVKLDRQALAIEGELHVTPVKARNAADGGGIQAYAPYLSALLRPSVRDGIEMWAQREKLFPNLRSFLTSKSS